GSGFIAASSAVTNIGTATTKVLDSSHLSVSIAGLPAQLQKVTLTVQNPDPGAGTSNSVDVVVAPPSLASLRFSAVPSVIFSQVPSVMKVSGIYNDGQTSDVTGQASLSYDSSIASIDAAGNIACNHSGT